MASRTAHSRWLNLIVLVPLGAAALGVVTSFGTAQTPTSHIRPLRTGVFEPTLLEIQDPRPFFDRMRAAGATAARLTLYWRVVAPFRRPANFKPSDPADPGYRFETFDKLVIGAVSHGLEPIVGLQLAPSWAEAKVNGPIGTRQPDPAQLAQFARAAARRYSGTVRPIPSAAPLPRVRYWQVWNEPNLSVFLTPQFAGAKAVSPQWYRKMVNSVAAAVKGVRSDNLVVAGGTAPFGRFQSARGTPPLQFMRELLCMKGRKSPKPSCKKRTRFDIWSHNPYTLGEPTHHANGTDNVSLGDLPEMRRLLDAAARAGHIILRDRVQFWVTEFSWDSNPPDPKGVPVALHARWVAEALYRMWQSGVSLVTWFKLRDAPIDASPFQSGLYAYDGATPLFARGKPALAAFRFPFVAFRTNARTIRVWGRTPDNHPAMIAIEQLVNTQWQQIATLVANDSGMFTAAVQTERAGLMRARMDKVISPTFSLETPPPLTLENPFGS